MFYRFFWSTPSLAKIQPQLSEFMVQGISPSMDTTCVQHLEKVTTVDSVKQQVEVLSTIANYHWWVSLTEKGTKIAATNYPKKSQHLLCSNSEGAKSNYIPSSPRNQLMFFKMYPAPGYSKRCFDTLTHLLNYDQDQQTFSLVTNRADLPPPSKKRKYTAREVVASGEDLLQSLNIELDDINMGDSNLFNTFAEDLTNEGEIHMRRLSEEGCILAMSDYSSTSGNLLPLQFAHVTANTSQEPPLVKCSCKTYSLIQGSALQKVQLDEDEEPFLSGNLTCFHCMFYKDYIHGSRFDSLGLNAASHAISKVQENLATLNNPVVPLGPTSTGITNKFSVVVGDSCSIVHVYFTPKNCFAKCQAGLCQARLSKTKIPKKQSKSLFNKDTLDLLCDHMKVVAANLEVLHATLPEFFNATASAEPDSEGEDLPEAGLDPDENLDDITIKQAKAPVNFNTDTGLWEHHAFSNYKPTLDPQEKELVEKTLQRNSYIRPDNFVQGGYKGPDLLPSDFDWCPCGVGVWTPPEFDYQTKVYTRMGILHCDVYKKTCLQGSCVQSYNGGRDFIFMLSKETGVGQEIFWDFTTRVCRSKSSFTGFCKEMTRVYTTNHVMSSPFISNKTFISSFFSWVAALEIDYRQEVDPWCRHNPKVIACDGTKIGVSLKYQKLDPPITQPNLHYTDDTLHQKYDRCFLPYPKKIPDENVTAFKIRKKRVSKAREYLQLLVKCAIQGTPLPETLDAIQDRRNFFDVIQEICPESIFKFLEFFVERGEAEAALIQSAANVLSLFATNDDALCSVLPFRFLQDILTTCDSVVQGADSYVHLENMKNFAVEISNLLLAAQSASQDILQKVVGFVRAIVMQLLSVHSVDRPSPPPDSHEGTYNPPSGTCYYFTPHGNQLRDLPSYSIQGKDRSKDSKGCTKDYPIVPYGGFGYMMLFFCPYHGHCYGFHLIDGGEGRKDPFAAMFKYMEEAPEEVYYDFACGLQEYCLNREPDFFKSVRFWHDLFHALNHICGINFRSTRVLGLDGANSEICEQFNSYLQCVKYTGSHLGQTNFMLFCQFFIYQWNKDKTSSFKQIARIALAGLR